MDGDSNHTKDIKETTQEEGKPISPPSVKKSREEIIEELTQFVKNLQSDCGLLTVLIV